MGGYNSMQLLLRLEQGLDLPPNSDVSLFIIHIGTNDWYVSSGTAARHADI